jgi:nitronate monooxygenase
MLVQVRGMKKLEQAIHPGSYQHLWSAGQSVEMVEDISSTKEIVERLMSELEDALKTVRGVNNEG